MFHAPDQMELVVVGIRNKIYVLHLGPLSSYSLECKYDNLVSFRMS
jgi:hypothetical protein